MTPRDELAPARGIAIGMALSLALWAAGAWMVVGGFRV
jgi:hypothetical protein